MIIVTITAAALLTSAYLGYLTYKYRTEALDNQVKFNASKEFSDAAAKRILELETNKSELATQIVKLSNAVNDYKIREENAKKEVNKEANKNTDNVLKVDAPRSEKPTRRGNKRKRPKNAAPTNKPQE